MTPTQRGAAAPEALAERFAACVTSGDLEGIMGLYAADAVVSLPRGREAAGPTAIRAAFAAALDHGAPLGEAAVVCRAIVSGSLAITSTTGADGVVRTQVARREDDGVWVWVRDGSRLREVECCLPGSVRAVA